MGARNSPQEGFDKSLDIPESNVALGFQPVSGFGDETGLNPNGLFRARAIPIRTLSSRHSTLG
jgi:hypothetical protein